MFSLAPCSGFARLASPRPGVAALKGPALIVLAALALGGCTVMSPPPSAGYPVKYPAPGYSANYPAPGYAPDYPAGSYPAPSYPVTVAPAYSGSPMYGADYYGGTAVYGGGYYYGGVPSVGYYPPPIYVAPRVAAPRGGYSGGRVVTPAPAIAPPRVVAPGYAAPVTTPSTGFRGHTPFGPGNTYQGGGYRASPGTALPAPRSGHFSGHRR